MGLGARRHIPLCGAVVSTIVAAPEPVSADMFVQEAAQTFVQTVGGNKDFLANSLGAFATSLAAFWTYMQSDEYKVQRAVAKFMEPFGPGDPQGGHGHHRQQGQDMGRACHNHQRALPDWQDRCGGGSPSWCKGDLQAYGGNENWKKELYESLQVDGYGMFETVLVRVKAELAKLDDPITKTPIILFEVPRTTTKGRGQNLAH